MIFDEIYRRFPALLVARRNLVRTRMRSALAMLGIVIGVVAIASLGMFGTTLQHSATSSLGNIGNEVIVSPAYDSGLTTIDKRDVRTLERAAGDAAVVPLRQRRSMVVYGRNRLSVTTYGMSNPGSTFQARSGRIPTPLRNGVLVGAQLADKLDLGPGNTVELDGQPYRVKAVLARQTGFNPVNTNSAVVIPESAFNGTGYDQVIVTASSGAAANRSAMAIKDALNGRTKRVSVTELASITDQIGQFFDILNLFLLGIGSISLVVAGVSILNVMLMSAIERRQEIGVLRAVGYRKRNVLGIMLSEAALLGVVGSVAGVAVSLLVGLVINQVALGSPLDALQPENLFYLGVAFAFGVVTSVVSGLYPAWKSANERPVDALRN